MRIIALALAATALSLAPTLSAQLPPPPKNVAGLKPTEHDLDTGRRRASADRYSSGLWFDGWREKLVITGLKILGRPIAAARTWLLTVGWRRHRRIDFAEVPG